MTRKDYDLLAGAIRAEVGAWRDAPYGKTRIRTIESLAAQIGNKISDENPNFDVDRFMADCGFPEE